MENMRLPLSRSDIEATKKSMKSIKLYVFHDLMITPHILLYFQEQ